MIYSYTRGWKIIWDKDEWIYADTGESADIERPCKRCGRPPTKEGYDACLGKIPGARNACCGHGVEKAYVQWGK